MVNEKLMRFIISQILILLVLPLLISNVFALPPLPTEFYGDVSYYNETVGPGKIITAYDPDNILCGSFTTVNPSKYGLLTCRGDDPFTIVDEGPVSGNQITFFIDGEEMSAVGDDTYSEGHYKDVWLIFPKIICGDNYCDDNFESCSICSADCGACPILPDNVTFNGTINDTDIGDIDITNLTGGDIPPGTVPPSTTPPSSGSSSGGGGGGEGGSTDGGGSILNMTLCEEDWLCNEWSICFTNETQIRECRDMTSCDTYDKRPPLIQECIYEGDCFDNVQNGLEEGIDCGGFCEVCPWDITPATCEDGRQNQKEEGVDCGGPCEATCDKKKPILELPLELCERKVQVFNPVYWLFLMGVILAILTDVYISRKRIKNARENKELADIDKSKRIVYTKRNTYIFISTIVLMTLLLIGYYHYFSQCASGITDFLWALLTIFLITPVIGFMAIAFFEYDEDDKIRNMNNLLDSHQHRIKEILGMHNRHLTEIENDISSELFQLSTNPEFKSIMEDYPKLKDMYKEMISLYDEYQKNANPMKVEKDLCQNMYDLMNNADFVELTTKLPRIKSIYDNIVLLYEQYEEKQKMYDELFKDEGTEKPEGKSEE